MSSRLILIICFVIGFIQTIAAQFSKPASNSIFGQFTYGNGSHEIICGSLTYINKKGFSITLQAANESRNSKNVPPDYEPGWLVIFGDGIPNVTIATSSVMVGKVFEEKSRLLQFDLRGGICYGTIERPVNFVKKSKSAFIFGSTSYYEYDIQKNRFIGFVVNPTMNIIVSRYIGFSAGMRSNINAQTITFGAELGVSIGSLRKRL